MEEKVFLDENGITVTSARISIGTNTIPLSSVSGVSMEVEKGAVYSGRALLIVGIFVAVSGHPQGSLLLLIPGALLAIFARTEYHLKIETSANKVKVMSESKSQPIEKALAAINEAIVARG